MSNDVALIVTRWGGWPTYVSLYLHTLAHNPTIDFLLLGDKAPARSGSALLLPTNVKFIHFPLSALLKRLREVTSDLVTDAVALRDSNSGQFDGGLKANTGGNVAKTNDLKPLYGEAFSDLLSGYTFWGYIQEDMILGDLRHFLRPEILNVSDVITPNTGAPRKLRANGAFMVYRNTRAVNRLWRSSKSAVAMLSTNEYLIFDDWWGPGIENMGRLLARVNATRTNDGERVRVHLDSSSPPLHGPLGANPQDYHGVDWRWSVDDTQHGWGSVISRNEMEDKLILCWRHGTLWVNVNVVVGGKPHNCLCQSTHDPTAAHPHHSLHDPKCGLQNQVGVFHLYHIKRTWVGSLNVSPERLNGLREFALTRQGLWLPTAHANRHSSRMELLSEGGEEGPTARVHRSLFDGFAMAVSGEADGTSALSSTHTWQKNCTRLDVPCVERCDKADATGGNTAVACVLEKCCWSEGISCAMTLNPNCPK